jgi:serine/threonine-protein kinase
MAEVFLGIIPGIGGFKKLVAIKRLLPQLAQDPEIIRMFLDEARLLARFSHPNIINVYDLGRVKNSYFLAMEYFHGLNLDRLLRLCIKKNVNLPPEYTAQIIVDVCDVLDYVHNFAENSSTPLRLIHRDISPQNIMLGFNGVVRVLDFGIAKDLGKLSRTRPATIKGKAPYIPPEQISQKTDIDHRADLFSLGIVLFELVTHRLPFLCDSEIDMLMSNLNKPIPDPRDLKPTLDDDLARIIVRATQKDPGHRYQSAKKMRIELEKYLLDRQVRLDKHDLAAFMHKLVPKKRVKIEAVMSGAAPVSVPPKIPQPTDTKPAAVARQETASVLPETAQTAPSSGEIAHPATAKTTPPSGETATVKPDPIPEEDNFSFIVEKNRSPVLLLTLVFALLAGGAAATIMFWDRLAGTDAGPTVDPEPQEEKVIEPIKPPAESEKQVAGSVITPTETQPEPDKTDTEEQLTAPPAAKQRVTRSSKSLIKRKSSQRRAAKLRTWAKKRDHGATSEEDAEEKPGRRESDSDAAGPDSATTAAVIPESDTQEGKDKSKTEPGDRNTTSAKPDGTEPPAAEVVETPPAKPTYQPPEVIAKRRIAGDDPIYPPVARAARIHAIVLVKIYIAPEGRVTNHKFLKSKEVFEGAVLKAIKTWRFRPHTINGRPVGTYTVYKFVFSLN